MTPPPVMVRTSRELDLSALSERVRFEQAFFRGFERATHNQLVRTLWEWDVEAGRVRTRIPYEAQRIWVIENAKGEIDAGIAVNTALEQLQCAGYGFSLPEDLADARAAGRVCEFLTFFAMAEHSLRGKTAFWRELFADLRSLGFEHGLATCSPKVLPLYRWMGANEWGSVQIGAEVRYFLSFDLRRVIRA